MYVQEFTITAVSAVEVSKLGLLMFSAFGVLAAAVLLGMLPKLYSVPAREVRLGWVLPVVFGFMIVGLKWDQYREQFQPKPGCQYTLTHANGHRTIELFTPTHNPGGGACLGKGQTVVRIQYEGGRMEYFVRPSRPLV